MDLHRDRPVGAYPDRLLSFILEVAIPSDNESVACPDFMRGAADIGTGRIAFTVRFPTGTFDPATTLVIVELDVDQNPSTVWMTDAQRRAR